MSDFRDERQTLWGFCLCLAQHCCHTRWTRQWCSSSLGFLAWSKVLNWDTQWKQIRKRPLKSKLVRLQPNIFEGGKYRSQCTLKLVQVVATRSNKVQRLRWPSNTKWIHTLLAPELVKGYVAQALVQGVPTSFRWEDLVKISNLREIRILKFFAKKFVKLKWDLHCLARM